MEEQVLTPPDENPELNQGAQVPASDAASQETAPVSFIDRMKVIDPDAVDENYVVGRYADYKKKVSEYEPKISEYEKQIQELSGKAQEFQSDGVRSVNAYVKSLRDSGVTDQKELNRKVREFVQESLEDYGDVADKNPSDVIRLAEKRRLSALGLDADTIDRMARKASTPPQKPDVANFDGVDDPEYLSAMEKYSDDFAEFKVRAKSVAVELEKSKPKVDFTPNGMETEEAMKARMDRYASDYDNALKTIDHVEIGGIKVPVKIEGELQQAVYNAASNPGGFVQALLCDDKGNYSAAKILQLVVTLESQQAAVELASKGAKSAAVTEFEKAVANPGTGGYNGGGQPTVAEGDAVLAGFKAAAELNARRS